MWFDAENGFLLVRLDYKIKIHENYLYEYKYFYRIDNYKSQYSIMYITNLTTNKKYFFILTSMVNYETDSIHSIHSIVHIDKLSKQTNVSKLGRLVLRAAIKQSASPRLAFASGV